ncbi:MAG: pyruvate kinase, partial [Methanobrevibacter sp.]
RPTRAEVNDVANAIYDEANATMLSGETSVGDDPVLVVKTMQKIIDEVEEVIYNTTSSL